MYLPNLLMGNWLMASATTEVAIMRISIEHTNNVLMVPFVLEPLVDGGLPQVVIDEL